VRALAALAVAAIIGAILGAPGGAACDADAAPASSSHGPASAASAEPAPASPAAPSHMSRDALLDALGTDDLHELERTVTAILLLPASSSDPDVLFAAGRACEDKLLDPGRAVALYDRVVAEHPTARVAIVATRHAAALREQIGTHGETAALAAELAQLIARADAQPADVVQERAERLATAAWPGAPSAALWLAEWLRRSGKFADAQAHYAVVTARWPEAPEARAALRGGAGCALEAHDWSLAETLARRLPADDADDRNTRDGLLAAAARGRRRARWYVAAWLAIAAAFAALLGSLVEAVLRSPPGTRRSALRPPIEVMFLGPVALVLLGVAFTAHRLIAPAVATISLGGIALAWLSGATLEQLRARGRSRRLRSVAHVVVCLAAVAALGYVALTHDNLVDMLIETVRFGPET
jgi:hypothetical protein